MLFMMICLNKLTLHVEISKLTYTVSSIIKKKKINPLAMPTGSFYAIIITTSINATSVRF